MVSSLSWVLAEEEKDGAQVGPTIPCLRFAQRWIPDAGTMAGRCRRRSNTPCCCSTPGIVGIHNSSAPIVGYKSRQFHPSSVLNECGSPDRTLDVTLQD